MPTDLIVSGNHLVLLGISGNGGDRNGIASVSVPVNVPTLAVAITLSPLAVRTAIGLSGVTCVGRPFHQLEDGSYQVEFQFQGFESPQTTQEEDLTTYEFDGDMAGEPIQTNPNFPRLKSKFGWNEADQKFPETIGAGAAGGTTALSGAGASTKVSPMAGQTDWLKVGATYSMTYAVSTVPAEAYANVGEIVDYPPGAEVIGVPRFPNRNWLKLSPRINNRKGSAKSVTLRYKLSGPGGHNRDVYNFDQLGLNGSYAGFGSSGLSTGSL